MLLSENTIWLDFQAALEHFALEQITLLNPQNKQLFDMIWALHPLFFNAALHESQEQPDSEAQTENLHPCE